MDTLKTVACLIVGMIVAFFVGSYTVKQPENLGGLVHNVQETFDAGIAVNGVEVISASRGISATSISGTSFTGTGMSVVNGSSTSSLSIGSSAIGTNPGRACLWNGSNFTILSFPSNSTTPSYATSTSC